MKRINAIFRAFIFMSMIFISTMGYSQIFGPTTVCDGSNDLYTIDPPNYHSCYVDVDWSIPSGNGVITGSTNGGAYVTWHFRFDKPVGQLLATVHYTSCADGHNDYTTTVSHYTHIIGLGGPASITGSSSVVAGEYFSKTYSIPDLSPETTAETYTWTVNGGVSWNHGPNYPLDIVVYGNTCDDFLITLHSTLTGTGCANYTADYQKTVTVNPDALTLAYFEADASGYDQLCLYPMGTNEGVFCVTDNDCASYYWYTQTHGAASTRAGIEPTPRPGVKRLQVIGDNTNSCATLRGVNVGDTKAYCRVTIGSHVYRIEFEVNVCNTIPAAPAYITGPQYIVNRDLVDYTYPAASGASKYHRWSSNSQALQVLGPYANELEVGVKAHLTGTYSLNVSSMNVCGESSPRSILITITNYKSDIAVVESTENDLSSINVFPNPGNDVINVSLPSGDGMYKVQLYSLEGELILEQDVNQTNATLDVSEFASGMYVVKISGNGLQHQQKLLISK